VFSSFLFSQLNDVELGEHADGSGGGLVFGNNQTEPALGSKHRFAVRCIRQDVDAKVVFVASGRSRTGRSRFPDAIRSTVGISHTGQSLDRLSGNRQKFKPRCRPATKCLQTASKLALKVLEWCSCH